MRGARMDKNLVTEIAQQIVSQEILLNWRVYLVVLALSFLSAAFASFVLPYLKRRGEQFATKADMDNVLEQLERTTQTTKSIESKISIDEWSHKEYRAIRRLKLEELVLATNKMEDWLDREKDSRLFQGAHNADASPIGTIRLLTALYFPEFDAETADVHDRYQSYMQWLVNVSSKIEVAGLAEDNAAERAALHEITATFPEMHKGLVLATTSLAAKAREVMGVILQPAR
jgi:hypothetical protein